MEQSSGETRRENAKVRLMNENTKARVPRTLRSAPRLRGVMRCKAAAHATEPCAIFPFRLCAAKGIAAHPGQGGLGHTC